MKQSETLRLELAMAEAMEDPDLVQMVREWPDEKLLRELMEAGIKFALLLREADKRCPG